MKFFRVFIAENVPSLNKGEMAILEGMLESFKVLGNVKLTMFSLLPHIDRPRYEGKVRIIDVNKYLHISDYRNSNLIAKTFSSLLFLSQHIFFLLLYRLFASRTLKIMKSGIWKDYLQSDLIVIGHDGTFGIGIGSEAPFVFYPIFIPFFANMLGKPVVIYGGDIHLPRRFGWFIGKAYKFALNRMDLITLRQRVSFKNLKALGVRTNKVFVTADLAFLLQPASPKKLEKIMRKEGIHKLSKPIIGITVTRQIASKAFPDISSESSYHKHLEMLVQVINHLIDEFNATIVFLPHCIGFPQNLDDRIVAIDIFRKCQIKEKVKVITNEYSAAELKKLIGQFDLFIGERLHSVINAMMMGVPSIVMSTSSDNRLDIIRMMGQNDSVCLVENLDSNALLAKIINIWSKRDKIKNELKSQSETMREQAALNGKLLKELLNRNS